MQKRTNALNTASAALTFFFFILLFTLRVQDSWLPAINCIHVFSLVLVSVKYLGDFKVTTIYFGTEQLTNVKM